MDSINKLIEYTEHLEEELLKAKADKIELSKEEAASIDKTLHLMHQKDESMSLDEFRSKHRAEIQGNRLP